jgi:hypothetical protein
VKLSYEVPERAPAAVELVSTPDRLTLTFPLGPTWPRQAATIGAFAIAAIYIAGIALVAWRDRAGASGTRTNAPVVCLSLAALWAVLGTFALRESRRRRHLPRTLIADGVTRTLALRAERSTRWRQWPLPDRAAICIYPYLTFYRRQRAVDVMICLEGFLRPTILLRFPPRDGDVADHFITDLHRLIASTHTPEFD